ncbi:PTS glucose/sucrose transporter subunit IIB [Lonepinella koalarum]
MDYKQLAQSIITHVGGKENISELAHCFTRLRLVLKDESKVDHDVINRLEGVMTVLFHGGNFKLLSAIR